MRMNEQTNTNMNMNTNTNTNVELTPASAAFTITLTDPNLALTFSDLAADIAQDVRAARSVAVTDQVADTLAVAGSVVVRTPDEFQSADRVLYDVRAARKAITALMEEKLDVLIKPIRAGLDKLYAVRRELVTELDAPLAAAETGLKSRMEQWQAAQREAARKAEADRVCESQRLAREAQAAADRARTATTVADVGRELERAAMLQQQARVVARTPVPLPTPVKAAASKTVITTRWRVTDMEKFICAVADGVRDPGKWEGKVAPSAVLMLDPEVMKAFWVEDRMTMCGWVGVEVYEDVAVTGR